MDQVLFRKINKTQTQLFTYEETEPKPLLDEIRAAIKQLKSGKAPGLDNVQADLLKHCGGA